MTGLFKTELIKPHGPWRTAGQVELATLEYVDWYGHRRLYEACGDIPPAELEAACTRLLPRVPILTRVQIGRIGHGTPSAR